MTSPTSPRRRPSGTSSTASRTWRSCARRWPGSRTVAGTGDSTAAVVAAAAAAPGSRPERRSSRRGSSLSSSSRIAGAQTAATGTADDARCRRSSPRTANAGIAANLGIEQRTARIRRTRGRAPSRPSRTPRRSPASRCATRTASPRSGVEARGRGQHHGRARSPTSPRSRTPSKRSHHDRHPGRVLLHRSRAHRGARRAHHSWRHRDAPQTCLGLGRHWTPH